VAWDEVESAASGNGEAMTFYPRDAVERARAMGDRFRPVLELSQCLPT
jgi:hypothetical protein